MSILSKIRPLQSNVPIVDSSGRPTPEFMLLWQQLFGNSEYLNEEKQTHDPALDNLSDLPGEGLVTKTAEDTFVVRELEGGAGVTITNPDGVAGNPLIEVDAISGGGGTYIPLVDGAEPPSFITDGAGQLILIPWSP